MSGDSPAVFPRLDDLRVRQRSAWHRGERLLVEDLVADLSPNPAEQELLELIYAEVVLRVDLGESCQLDEYLLRFPPLAESLRRLFAVHQALDPTGVVAIHSVRPSNGLTDSSAAKDLEDTFVPRRTIDPPGLHSAVGTTLGRYVVERVLGEGAFGTVFLARDEDLRRLVAIKVPRRDRFASVAGTVAFMDEARTVARLRHPGIVAVYDVGRDADQFPFVVLEYIDGPSLHAEAEARPVSPRRAAELMASVADAIAFAHKQGFIHRDLKPANILLDAGGMPHVSDFGLALHESRQAERRGEYAGTTAYMSPEQVRGEAHRLDGRTDVWSLGVILYRLLTRRLPFAGTSLQEISDEIQHREPKPPRQIDGSIPLEMERIIGRCCQKKVADRYSTAADLAADLRAWLGQHAPVSAQAAPEPRPADVADTVRLDSVSTHISVPTGFRKKLFIGLAASGLGLIALFSLWKALPALFSQADRVPKEISPTVKAPLEGTLDVLVWNKQRGKLGLNLRDPVVRSLRHDDQVRVVGRMNRPAYLYLLWIDAAGKVQPLYPWEPGHWDRRPDHETAVQQVSLPEQADLGWPIEGPAGMETLLLLARDAPFSDTQIRELQAALQGLPPQSAQQPGAIVDFVNGQIVPASLGPPDKVGQDRGPKLFDPQRLDDPVLQTQTLLQSALKNRATYSQAVSFANVGTK